MFVVIEYTDYYKEQTIKLKGYFNNIDNAIKYSKETYLKQLGISTENKTIIITEDEYGEEDEYVQLENDLMSKVLHRFYSFEIQKTTDEEIHNIINKIKKENITIDDLINYLDISAVKEEFRNIKKLYDINKEISFEEVKDFINYLILNDYYIFNLNNHKHKYCSSIFAIVELQSLDN